MDDHETTTGTEETKAPPHNLKMVNGSTSYRSYAVFARRGNMLLCIKPNIIIDGSRMGVEGTTYIGARLRSAPIGETFAEEDKANAVVQLGVALDPDKAWPLIEFEKVSPQRASCQVGVFLRGNAQKDPEALLKKFKGGDILTEMAEYLFSLIGDGEAVCTQRDLRKMLDVSYTPQIEGIIKSIAAKKEFAEAMEENVGIFGIQSAILAKLHKKHHGGQDADVEDKEEGDDPDGDGTHDAEPGAA